MVNNKIIFIFISLIIILNSCEMNNTSEMISYSNEFIDANSSEIIYLENELNKIDSVGAALTFDTKPYSGILNNYCLKCKNKLSITESVRIANLIDNLKLSHVNYFKNKYLEIGFKKRNSHFNYYFIRNYKNISDTLVFKKSFLQMNYLKKNWVLYSDLRNK